MRNRPLLELIRAQDPFKLEHYGRELRDRFPERVTTIIIEDAASAATSNCTTRGHFKLYQSGLG